jgi:hypothetical protein
MGKKRINPSTNKYFERGDLSEDREKKFFSYRTNHIKKDGFFAERWFALDKFEEELNKLANAQRSRQAQNQQSNLPKRINPETGNEFKSGEINSSGQYFIGYIAGGKTAEGYRGESWGTKEAWLRVRVGNTFGKISKRASEKEIPIDIDIDYLFEIFPIENMRCPILDIEMNFAGDRFTSPSVDRLSPDLGYTKGNVAWVSLLANVVKRERTPFQLRRIADWIEEQPIYKKYYANN